ncbi:MAG: hypothetical protein Fues2KO_43660 [Fuerstiella sp.]
MNESAQKKTPDPFVSGITIEEYGQVTMTHAEVVTEFRSFSRMEVWRLVEPVVREVFPPETPTGIVDEGKRIPLARFAEKHFKPSNHLRVYIGDSVICTSNVAAGDHSLIDFEGVPAGTEDRWVSIFESHESFSHGWAFDWDFYRRQNQNDPKLYAILHGDPSGLPLVNNGLPAPLNRMVIDTSNNPGRRIVRKGYVEAVGSTMWFSEKLLRRLKLSPDELLSQPWLNAEQQGNVIRIQVQEQPFTSAEGIAGELQDRLREFLFGRATP